MGGEWRAKERGGAAEKEGGARLQEAGEGVSSRVTAFATMNMRCFRSIEPGDATLRTANVAFGLRAWLA